MSTNQMALKEMLHCSEPSLLHVAGIIGRAWTKADIVGVYDDILAEISSAKQYELALRRAGIRNKPQPTNGD